MHMFNGMGGGWMMILWWVIIIAAIVLLVRYAMPTNSVPIPQKSALDILKERYAQGEISKEEFMKKKQTLTE